MGGNASGSSGSSCKSQSRPTPSSKTGAAGRFLSKLCSTLLFVLCCCCCRARPGIHSSGNHMAVSGTRSTRVLNLSISGLRQAAATCSRGAFCAARLGTGSQGTWRQLATASARRRVEEGRGTAGRGAAGGVYMKANKKNKRKREQRQGNDAAGGGAPQRQPQRVTNDAPVSVRTQIKYAKMKKSMEKQHNSSKKMVNNKYRRAKPLDYEDIVEPEDLSHIYMPDIAPSLMVDGYNIIFYWSKCCMLAEGGDLEAARQMLVEELDTLSAMRGWTVTVVFDAYKRKGGHKRKYVTPNKIEVVFTSNGESADMYVERLTEELKDAGCPNVMVATGDKLMQSLVTGAGAEVFSPDRIIEEIEVCHSEAVAFTDMYMRRKESMIAKTEMQELLDRVRSAEEDSKRKRTGGGRGNRGGGQSFNIEDDL